MKKRLVGILLVCCLLVSLALPLGAFADETAQLVVSTETAKPGDEVTVSISTKNNPGVIGFDIGIEYDSTKLEYIGYENGEFTGWEVNNGTKAVCIGDADNNVNGVILKLKFKVLDGATGTAKVNVICGEAGAANYNEQFVAFSTVAGGVEITAAETHTHSYTDKVTAPTCTEKGYTTHTCACGDSYKDNYVDALGHKTEIKNAKAATATEAGYTGDEVCTVCGTTVKTGEVIPATGTGHTHSYTDVVTAPTCTEKGYTTHTCSCGDVKVDTYVAALGHKTEATGAYDATCTEAGYTGDEVCTVCGEKVKVGSIIDPLGHDYKDGICTRCGENDPEHKDPTPSGGFTDVSDDAYYAKSVAWAVDKNITGGYSDNTFRPMDICTRAQIVTFIWRCEGCPEPAGTAKGFNDVKEGTYYYDAVLWAAEQGVTGGFNDGGFHPNEQVTRAQAMTFLWRAAGCPAVPAGTVNTFGDVTTSNYFYNAVLWAVASGVTGGYDSTTFGSMDGCTRAQIVTFLYRCNVSAADVSYTDSDELSLQVWESSPIVVFVKNGEAAVSVSVENGALKTANIPGVSKIYASMSGNADEGEYTISGLLESGAAPAAYTATLQSAVKSISERHAAENAAIGGGRACLFDLDGDGVKELICLYYSNVFERECCCMSIYTIADGQVQTIAEKYILAYEA